MSERHFKCAISAVLVVAMLATAACDHVKKTSQTAQQVTKAAFEETKGSWRDLFTYHPPVPDPMPQTRYCYQMQSDIVCYDSEQSGLTAKLIGYQDGENIAWVQPGGGSLGVSGEEPVALRPILPAKTKNVNLQNGYVASSDPVIGDTTTEILPPTTGQIEVSPLTQIRRWLSSIKPGA